jgi:tetratricopeptide (TPR) repeat protein
MKKIFLFFILTFIFCYPEEIEITLKEQAVIDFFNYPDLTEGIIDLLYLTVDNYWHSGEYSKIFPVFYLITRIKPDDLNAYALGGWFLINGIAPKYKGKKKEEIKNYAVEFMKEGINKKAEDYRLYWEIGYFYYNEGDFDKAIEYLNKAEKYEHPFYVENLKAHIYMKKGEVEKAISEWEKIKEKYPERKKIAEKFIKELKGKR